MSRLESIKQRPSKLEVSGEQSDCGEIKSFRQQAYENLEEVIRCSDELRKNALMVEELRVDESELNEMVRKNREEICKLKHSIKQLENTLSMQKCQLDARKKDHEYNMHKLKQRVSIETTLAEATMKNLGMRLKMSSADLNNWEIQFTFSEKETVSLMYNALEHSYDLQAIDPPHPAFRNAREFLHDTDDLPGFLFAVREYHFKANKVTPPDIEQMSNTQRITDMCDS